MWEIWVPSLSWKDPAKKGMAIHMNILAWKTPWTEDPRELYSPWGRIELDMREQLSFTFIELLYADQVFKDKN